MGCDIHCYPEFRKPNNEHWSSWSGRVNPGRNYELFGFIAGVRGEGEPVVPQRGLPPGKLGFYAFDDHKLSINDKFADSEGFCTFAKAQEWAKHGSVIVNTEAGSPWYVTHPDWHSHTWLTPAELEQAIKCCTRWEPQDDYFALLAALKSLESRGNEVRLVVWFDN